MNAWTGFGHDGAPRLDRKRADIHDGLERKAPPKGQMH